MLLNFVRRYIPKYNAIMKNILLLIRSTKKNILGYQFILEGYYYCEKNCSTMLVIRIPHKRITLTLSVKEIITNQDLIKELSPIDACIIGVLANNERNGIQDTQNNDWKKMRRIKNHDCFMKFKPRLKITKTYFDQHGQETMSLYLPDLNKEMEISTVELLKNRALLHSLEPLQALSVGYSASESWLRHQSEAG